MAVFFVVYFLILLSFGGMVLTDSRHMQEDEPARIDGRGYQGKGSPGWWLSAVAPTCRRFVLAYCDSKPTRQIARKRAVCFFIVFLSLSLVRFVPSQPGNPVMGATGSTRHLPQVI
ncbi:hypothetical protein LY78DRAFT_390012 [Colletotrichum sublineola]|nr:hypothetical protein LY78DRAFT_390012 [Colletotrichum sublineola]